MLVPGRLQNRADSRRPCRAHDHGQRAHRVVGGPFIGGALHGDLRGAAADGDDGVDVGCGGQYPQRPVRRVIRRPVQATGLQEFLDEDARIPTAGCGLQADQRFGGRPD